jgi:adenylate cyclase
MSQTRRLAAIVAADVAGYSRLMGADDEGTHERLKAHLHELVDPKIAEHHGRTVKNTGDGFLAEFASVVDAVRCAVELQRGMADRNTNMPEDKRIAFRVGINLGDVIADNDDIFGDGVNIAARLEALAEPGGICVARTVRNQIRDKLPYPFEDMGEQSVKNIARPVRADAMSAASVASTPLVAVLAQPSPALRPMPSRSAVIAASAAVVIAIGAAVWWAWPNRNPSTASVQATATASPQTAPVTARTTAPRLSIVVLPFANLSDDREQEYFADGITDDLTTDLSRIDGSFVIARTTAFTYKGKAIDAKQIGRELGIRYVIEGSVRLAGDQVQMNVQLIDAESGAHLWADRFETDRRNLAEAQSEITGRLARTLNIELVRDSGRRIELDRTVDPDARDLVTRARALLYRPTSMATYQEAKRAFERALEIDPRFIDAKVGLAQVLVASRTEGMSSSGREDEERAEQLLIEALERDANNPAAHRAMGNLRRVQGRLADSRIELETAIALDRNDKPALLNLGITLLWAGQPELAIPYLEKSFRLSPHDPYVHVNYFASGACHLFLGNVDQAIDLFRKARAANPRVFYLHLWLAGALGLKGQLDEARSALGEAVKLKPEVNSLAQWRANQPYIATPPYWALRETTLNVGLRRAGFPDE